MSKSTVIQDIKSKIRPNGEQNIIGQILHDVLVESVNLVPEKVSELVNDSPYQTKANLYTALASKDDVSSIPTKTSQLANDTGFVTSTEVGTTYTTKAEVPTKTSQLTNDSTYQTKDNLDTALECYAKTSDVNFKNVLQDEAIQSKQDKLVSGTNIKTINGVPVLGSGDIKTPAPTKVSELDNDTGYLTEHQSLEAYYQKAAAQLDNRVVVEAVVAALDAEVPEDENSVSAEATEGRP